MAHIYILITVAFSIYTQLVVKWQMSSITSLPDNLLEKFLLLSRLLLNPWIFSTLVGTFIGGLSWMAALSKFPVSYAFPFVSLAFVGVTLLSNLLFQEPISWSRLIGTTLIVTGLVVSSASLTTKP